MEYYYFYFNPIPFEMVQWKLRDQFDKQTIHDAYGEWSNWFVRNSERFYRHQWTYHYQLLARIFANQNQLDREEQNWSDDEREEFYEHLSSTTYPENQIKTNEHQNAVRETLSGYLEQNVGYPRRIPISIKMKITRLWFNNIVDNTPETQSKLAKMNYSSKYLKTEHWRRIRALKILIHYNRCSTLGCQYTLGEAFFGDWTQDLHVHHVSYKNRGNERYEDVLLLCRCCHQEVTKNPNTMSVCEDNLITPYM